jgi:arginase
MLSDALDLHVVEVGIAHTWGRPGGTLREAPEWAAFRAAGVYEPAGEGVTFAPVTLAAEELSADPVDDLALLGGRIAGAVAQGARHGARFMMVGGNCACVPGMVGGLQRVHGTDARIGLVWVDAHGDFNTPRTTQTGFLGGMPVAVVAGLCHAGWREGAGIRAPIPTDRITMVDVRRLYPGERALVEASDITVVPMGDPALGEAVDPQAAATHRLNPQVDLDVHGPARIPAPIGGVPGGADVAETVSALERVFDTGRVGAFALVSLYATRPGGDRSVAAAIDILRPCLRRWAQAGARVLEEAT